MTVCTNCKGATPPPGMRCRVCGAFTPHAPGHHCHARGCPELVPPEMLMCRRHWFMVPKPVRARVWATYRAGQCDDMRPSEAWHEAADAAIAAVAAKERPSE